MIQPKFLPILFLILVNIGVKAQDRLDGLWGLSHLKSSYPEIFIRFNKDTFEFTDYRQGIQYGKGIWTYGKNNLLTLSYDSLPYQKSFVRSYCDSPTEKAERLILTVFVYDGFSKQAAYKPTIAFYDSLNHELLDIKADTSGKAIATLYHPIQFKKVKVEIYRAGYDDSPEFDLTNYAGKNLYLQFYINLSESNYKKKSTETYYFQKSQMGDITLKDHSGHEFVFTDYSWRYGL